MEEIEYYYKSRNRSVTDYQFVSTEKTYIISHIEKVSIKRPLMYFTIPALLFVVLFSYNFWEYIYDIERKALGIFAILSLMASHFFGTLHIHSKVLSEVADFGSLRRLSKIRKAIDKATLANIRRENS